LRNKIESKLEEILGYKVTVILRTGIDLQEVVKRNPFVGHVEDTELYVTFLSNEPAAEAVDALASYKNSVDNFSVIGREVYLWCRRGYGRSLFSNRFLEQKLSVLATTRNWKTVNKIISMINRE
jgi:uncharacterized protein (DUF1697 family)